VRLVADQAIYHSDREDRTTWPPGLDPYTVSAPPSGGYAIVGSKFETDMEHENVLGVPVYYYLTGDESIRDALIDHGEWFLRETPFTKNCSPGDRGVWQRSKWHAVLWEMTGDPRYKAELDKFVDNYLCSTVGDPTNVADAGQDMNRGYIWTGPAPMPGQPREQHIGPLEYVQAEGMYEAMRVLPDSDPRKEELADRLLGFAYYAAKEAYYDGAGPSSGCRGFSSPPGSQGTYKLDAAADEGTRNQFIAYDYFSLISEGFRLTHDPLFLYVGRRLIGAYGAFFFPAACGSARMIGNGYIAYSSWAAQQFMWEDLHQGEFGTVFLSDRPGGGLTVTSNGSGSYTLSWVVPPSATKYQIKYGPNPMVPNLGFDHTTRTYQNDPATYDNFWAGNGDLVTNQPHNVSNEPPPAPAGTTQTFTISGLDPSQTYHFAMRVFTGGTGAAVPPPEGPAPPPFFEL